MPCLHVCRLDKTKTFRVFQEKQFAATPLDFCHYILFCAVTRSPVSAEAVNELMRLTRETSACCSAHTHLLRQQMRK